MIEINVIEEWMKRLRDGQQLEDGSDMDEYTDELQRRINAYRGGKDAQDAVRSIQAALNKEIGLR